MYETIVLGTDGSDRADNATEQALAIAEQSGASLHAITVVNTRRYGEPALSSTELVLNELEDRASEQLTQIRQAAEARNLEVTTQSFHGEPAAEIINYADSCNADLIVMGSSGRTHPDAALGSTSDRVIRGTDRSVLLA